MTPELRPAWYAPDAALEHASGLRDTPAGRAKYLDYLAWLAEDEPASKEQRFAKMSTGWVIGTAGFAQETMRAQVDAFGQGRRMTNETRVAQEAIWQETVEKLLGKLGRTADELKADGKSAAWKLALAAALKARTTATNRWLGTALHLGSLHEVSRKLAAWTRAPDAALSKKLALTPNPKADPVRSSLMAVQSGEGKLRPSQISRE